MTTSDLYSSLCKVQSDFVSPATHNPLAAYLPYRRYLVDWMTDVGEQVRFSLYIVFQLYIYIGCFWMFFDVFVFSCSVVPPLTRPPAQPTN